MNEKNKKLTDIEIDHLNREHPFLVEYLNELSRYDEEYQKISEKHPGIFSLQKYIDLGIPFSKDLAEKQIQIDDEYITIYYEGGNGEYSIELSRIKTPLELIIWIYHLCGKTWFDKEHVEVLIEKISAVKKFDLDKFC